MLQQLVLTPICLVNNLLSYTILENYNILSDELKSEVNDFIDFLLRKNASNLEQFSNNIVLSKTSPYATLKKIQLILKIRAGILNHKCLRI